MLILWTPELTGSRFYFTTSKLRLKLYSGPKNERDSWFTTMRSERMESYVFSYAFWKKLPGPIVDPPLLGARVAYLKRNFLGKDFPCVTELISRQCLRRIGRFIYVRHVDSLCLGEGYIVFPLRLAGLSRNDEINEDARKILDLYVADEDENPDIPLPDGIPIDLGIKEPISNPRSPPYRSKELYIRRKVNKKKTHLREKIPIERQSSEASGVVRKRSMEKYDVPIRGALSECNKTMANSIQKNS
ncbi:hypothetical protein CUMW_133020 [Citrus unshiu]|nr:hypothetical protein CUMW_133020 [Citrus unshiu]